MKVLDLGCGDGHLTLQISNAGADVIGVDVDPDFVAAAVQKGVKAIVADGHNLPFQDEFDRVFSNATLHWLSKDPAGVVNGIHRALRDGGKLVAEFGGQGNVHVIVSALGAELESRGFDAEERNPWFFPSAEAYASMLTNAGFSIKRCELVEAPTSLPNGGDISGWLRTFCSKWLHDIEEPVAQSILSSVRERLSKSHLLREGTWFVDYVRLR
eukprot:TRINITY_DN50041_c0_g1_i1.p1 TRINITY_DN50041_c0_g1~~TRINITY_DN50041_c0_g1_i1.p1  ORF type:complete len:245 (+),score=49.58 TRINITY_DN50041_c0_g1_i1:97-735(+)